jgi:hypothetical protein
VQGTLNSVQDSVERSVSQATAEMTDRVSQVIESALQTITLVPQTKCEEDPEDIWGSDFFLMSAPEKVLPPKSYGLVCSKPTKKPVTVTVRRSRRQQTRTKKAQKVIELK